ncbi:putative MFS monocarboxylate transporter [Xylona heveae TC161]|uniref:Putative MFS monocarboxylate transporter n=1 Tax=Xylona heveae (strain CBS 132557 / TC161) TaxID=1328760 RepID=A0A165G597_XYLHT|nr:putative MFS monocarboxylate transporter [Xylona heveae TC161]KZF21754.1 putative MFS monocarboxylate transporter [Xylona heveae TC161]
MGRDLKNMLDRSKCTNVPHCANAAPTVRCNSSSAPTKEMGHDADRHTDEEKRPELEARSMNNQEKEDDCTDNEDDTHTLDDDDARDEEGQRADEEVGRASTRLSIRRSKSSCRDPGPPPDGGLTAWTQAVMAHLVVFGTWGYISSFGVFQTYYVETLGHEPSDISWVGSVQIFLLFFVGTFSGRATDAGYYRHIFVFGTTLQLLGMFTTSLCTKYWQLFLAQGICTGIGDGLVFCPTIALLATYFSKNRALALGISACGTATGGMILPVVVQQLLPKIGFGWTVRVIAFIVLGTQMTAFAFTRTRLPPRKSGAWVEWGAFRELPYALFTLGMFLCFLGLYFAYYYVGSYGRDIIGVNQSDSITLLLVMNGVGIVTRLLSAFAADHWFGCMNLLIPYAAGCGLCLYGWSGAHSRGGLFAFAVVYGMVASGMQGLFPATLSSLTTDLKRTGVRMGMVFSVISFACLTGAPIGGALVQRGNGHYLYAQMFAGSMLVCGSLILLAARTAKIGLKLARF